METNFGKQKQDGDKDNHTGLGKEKDSDLEIVENTGNTPDKTKSVMASDLDGTGTEPENPNPFGRKPMLMRTPPTRRALSAPNEKERTMKSFSSWTLPSEDPTTKRDSDKEKRKRDGDSPIEDRDKEIHKKQREENKFKNIGTGTQERIRRPDKDNENPIVKLMENIVKEIKVLRSIVHEHKNTKVEIKDSSSRLEKMALSLERQKYTENLHETGSEKQTKNRKAGRNTDSRDIAIQTESNAWKTQKEDMEENIRKKMATNRGFEGYKKLPPTEWPKEVFSTITEVTGNPLWEGTENDLAFFMEKEDQMLKGIGRQIKRRFPEVTELHKRPEGCAAVIYESKFIAANKETIGENRTSLARILIDDHELGQYMNIVDWKTKVKNLGVTRVGLWVDDLRWHEIKKMIEHVFWGDDVKIMAYSPKRLPKNPEMRAQNKTSSRPPPRPVRRKGNPQDAIVISAPNRTYSDLLREVKGKVDASALGITVKGARSTRRGDLLITLKDGEHSAPILLDAIHKELGNGGVKARPGGRRTKILHIKGMDAMATPEELRNIIAKELNEDETEIVIKSMRPAFGQCQNATVEMETEWANKLLEKRTIRIGWSLCRVQDRISVSRCSRCWAFGHNRSTCNGEDRTQACLKCAEEGHRVKDCQNTPYCPICQKRGHRADSMSCPVYRGEVLNKTDTRSRTDTDTQEKMDYASNRDDEQQTTSTGAKSDSQTTLHLVP